jgi:hypothetical protein
MPALADSGWYTVSWVLIPVAVLLLAVGVSRLAKRHTETAPSGSDALERFLLRRLIDSGDRAAAAASSSEASARAGREGEVPHGQPEDDDAVGDEQRLGTAPCNVDSIRRHD